MRSTHLKGLKLLTYASLSGDELDLKECFFKDFGEGNDEINTVEV